MESKEVHVKAHIRTIRQKAYRFVCKECDSVVERYCYPSRPLYCERCRPRKKSQVKSPPTKPKKSRKPRPMQYISDVS